MDEYHFFEKTNAQPFRDRQLECKLIYCHGISIVCTSYICLVIYSDILLFVKRTTFFNHLVLSSQRFTQKMCSQNKHLMLHVRRCHRCAYIWYLSICKDIQCECFHCCDFPITLLTMRNENTMSCRNRFSSFVLCKFLILGYMLRL